MNEELDNDLKNRIRQVFENYEDTTADEGWLLLREKFPGKKRRRAIAWYWATAALLLLCLGFGLWFSRSKTNQLPVSSIAQTNIYKSPIEQKFAQGKSANIQNNSRQQLIAQSPAIVTNQGNVKSNNIQQPEVQKPTDAVKLAASQQGTHISQTDQQRVQAVNSKANAVSAQTTQAPVTDLRSNALVLKKPGYVLFNTQPGEQGMVQSFPLLSAGQQEEKKNEDAVMAMIKKDQLNNLKASSSSIKEDKRPVYSVYTATYVNYAKGSNSQFNAGGGFSADIHLNKNLSLTTGLAVTQNTLSYTATPSGEAATTFAAVASKNVLITATYSPSGSNAFSEASPNLKNLNASLVGIDVPVNIKYFIKPEKTDTYFSAGLSSGTFANETYNYKYNYSSLFNAAAQTVSTSSSFNSFYLANMANFSFGFGYPVGKTTRLIIEPFVKYPLSGLGSQQISFGSGGINLKLNFLPSKK